CKEPRAIPCVGSKLSPGQFPVLGLLLWRPLLQHARSLPERQLDPRPALGHAVKDALGLVEAGPREHEVNHALPVTPPLLDLVEVAPVGVDRIIGLFVGPIAHYAIRGFDRLPLMLRSIVTSCCPKPR